MPGFGEIILWSELRHRIIAFQLEADLPKLTDDSKQALTYIPVYLGGLGPPDSFWPERRRAVALREEGLSLDEFILQESARCTRSPTKEEREAQQERELPFLRKLIDLTYEAYKKDWVEQGKEISPAFLWAVRRKVFAAVTLYLMEDEKLTRELLNTSCLHLPVGFAPAHLARLLRRLPMSSLSHRRFQATDYIHNLMKRIAAEALKLESVEPSLEKAKPRLRSSVGNGEFCDQVIGEVIRVRNMCLQSGRTVAQVEQEFPNMAVWKVVASLSAEDQDAFRQPRTWGPKTGYAKMVLAKHFDRSPDTVDRWVKTYRRTAERNKVIPK